MNQFSKKRLQEIASGSVKLNHGSTIKQMSVEKFRELRDKGKEALLAALRGDGGEMSGRVVDTVFGKKPKKKKEEITYPHAEKMCDATFSQWKRLSSADEKGIVRCFICMIPMRWERSVLMHFQSRTCVATQWDEVACQAGCRQCNGKENGDRVAFGFRLDAAYGKGTAEALTAKSKGVVDGEKVEVKYSVMELLTKAREYRELIADIRAASPGKFKTS